MHAFMRLLRLNFNVFKAVPMFTLHTVLSANAIMFYLDVEQLHSKTKMCLLLIHFPVCCLLRILTPRIASVIALNN